MVTNPFGVGEKLIVELLKNGETVHTIFPTPKDVPMSFLGKINLKYGFTRFDQDLNIEKGLPRQAKNVFHTFELYSGLLPRVFMANVMTTLLLLEWSKKVGVEKFIFLSSGEVYGYGTEIKENSAYNPRSFYATTKFHAETLCRYYTKSFETKILRIFFPFGKNLTQGYLHNLTEVIKSGGVIETDYATICPTFIDDIATPMMNLRNIPGSITFNICGEPLNIEDLINAIGKIIGKTAKKLNTGKISLCGNCEKARNELNYKATPFSAALKTITVQSND